MLTDRQVTKLIKDVGLMSRELAKISRNDKDPDRRKQAKRWSSTLGRTICSTQAGAHASRGR